MINGGMMYARALVVTCLLAAGAWGAETTSQPATQPVRHRVNYGGKINDAWLSTLALDELKRAGESGEYEKLEESIKGLILARLTRGGLDDLRALNDAVYVLKASEYLPRAIALGEGGEKLARMLLQNRQLSRLLFRAIPDGETAGFGLKNLLELYEAEPQAVADYPDFTVAAALARPLKNPSGSSFLESYRWYTKNPKVHFRYDLKQMPYELAQYLANSRLSTAERTWAATNYMSARNPPACYFDVRYDYDYYTRGTPKKISTLPYTLQNLKLVGGVCIDQAYFASEVCKAIGVPATIVVGKASFGGGHAWVAAVKISPEGKSVGWDAHTGRYAYCNLFIGNCPDPIANKTIEDYEMMILGFAAQLPLDRREEAATAVELARLVAMAGDTQAAGDIEQAGKLIDAYNRRLTEKDEKALKIAPDAAKGDRKLDAGMIEHLLGAALDRNLVYRPAWEEIVAMRTAGTLPAEHIDQYMDIVVSRTIKDFPDYSAVLLTKMVPTVTDGAAREKIYQKLLPLYPKRPDIQGRLLLALGNDYLLQDKKDKAFATFSLAAEKCIDLCYILLPAADKLEQIIMDSPKLAEPAKQEMVLNMYKKLFQKAPKTGVGTRSRADAPYYQIGKKIIDLLTSQGKPEEAAAYAKMIAR